MQNEFYQYKVSSPDAGRASSITISCEWSAAKLQYPAVYAPPAWSREGTLVLTHSTKAKMNILSVFPDWDKFVETGGLYSAEAEFFAFESKSLFEPAFSRFALPQSPTYQIHFGSSKSDSTGCLLVGLNFLAVQTFAKCFNLYVSRRLRIRRAVEEYVETWNSELHEAKAPLVHADTASIIPSNSTGYIPGRSVKWALWAAALDINNKLALAAWEQIGFFAAAKGDDHANQAG